MVCPKSSEHSLPTWEFLTIPMQCSFRQTQPNISGKSDRFCVCLCVFVCIDWNLWKLRRWRVDRPVAVQWCRFIFMCVGGKWPLVTLILFLVRSITSKFVTVRDPAIIWCAAPHSQPASTSPVFLRGLSCKSVLTQCCCARSREMAPKTADKAPAKKTPVKSSEGVAKKKKKVGCVLLLCDLWLVAA